MYSKHKSGMQQRPCIGGKGVLTSSQKFMKQHKEFMEAMPDQTIQPTIENCDDSFNLSFSEASINDIKVNSPLKGGNFGYYGPKLDECGGAQ